MEMQFHQLKQLLNCTVVTKNDESYSSIVSNLLWNKDLEERLPLAVVIVDSQQDVCIAVRFAYDNKLNLCIHAGGHSIVGCMF
jgi:FAD/FMN-containing dehydrogenase